MATEANGKENYVFYEEATHLPNKCAVFDALGSFVFQIT